MAVRKLVDIIKEFRGDQIRVNANLAKLTGYIRTAVVLGREIFFHCLKIIRLNILTYMCSIVAVVECFREAGVDVCNVQLFISEIGLAEEEERAGERADKFVGELEDAIKDIEVNQCGVDTNSTQFSGNTSAAVILCWPDPLKVVSTPVHQVRVLMITNLTLRASTMPSVSNQQVAE